MAGDVKHDFHLVKPSPWPLLGSLAMLLMVLGAAGSMKGLWFIEQGNWLAPLPGFIALVFVLVGWWGDVVKESRGGDHSEVVQISLRYGMVLFIALRGDVFRRLVLGLLRFRPVPGGSGADHPNGNLPGRLAAERRRGAEPVEAAAAQYADPAHFGRNIDLGASRPATRRSFGFEERFDGNDRSRADLHCGSGV